MSRSKFRNVVAAILVFLIALQSTAVANAGKENNGKKNNGKKKYSEYVVDENNTKYLVSVEGNDINDFTIEYLDEKGKNRIEIVFSNGTAQKTEYKITGKDRNGNNKYKKNKSEQIDVNSRINDFENRVVSSSGYGKKVSMNIPYKSGGKEYYHYYRIGNSGADLGYVEIGCVHVYRLKSDAKYFLEYKNKVDEEIREVGSANVSAGMAVTGVLIMFLSPSKVAAGAAMAALGFDATSLYHLWNARCAYKEADTFFDLAKAYGTMIR